MAHSKHTKDQVRYDYIYKRLPLSILAKKYDTTSASIRAWRDKAKHLGNDWDQARYAHTLCGGDDLAKQANTDFEKLFSEVYKQILRDDIKPTEKVQALATLADAKIKTVKAMRMSDPKQGELAIALDVLNEFSNFIKTHHPDKLSFIAPLLLPFGRHINQKWGTRGK